LMGEPRIRVQMVGYGNHLKDQFEEFQITRCQVPTLQVVTKYREFPANVREID
jgi:hypothetical protein